MHEPAAQNAFELHWLPDAHSHPAVHVWPLDFSATQLPVPELAEQ